MNSMHKTLGSFILIDRISHATSACGIVERLDSKENNTVIFTDGEKSVTVRIFDSFIITQILCLF